MLKTYFAFSLLIPISRADAQQCQPSYNVGFRVVTTTARLKMAVRYPTSAKESIHNYTPEISGSATKNGGLANCGKFPPIVFSHGFGGCGTQSIFFTEQLVRAGYVVAAPDHQDAGCSVDGSAGRFALQEESFFEPVKWSDRTYVSRKNEIAAAITWMTAGEWSRIVDANRIGVAGHSVGGYVALGVTGGWSAWKDPRIKALLLFSPYANPFLIDKRLASMDVPVMYQGAQFDLGITPFLKGPTGAFAMSRSPKYFMELKGGSQFEWTNALCFGSGSIRIDPLPPRKTVKS